MQSGSPLRNVEGKAGFGASTLLIEIMAPAEYWCRQLWLSDSTAAYCKNQQLLEVQLVSATTLGTWELCLSLKKYFTQWSVFFHVTIKALPKTVDHSITASSVELKWIIMGKEDDLQNRVELGCSRYCARCLEHSLKERLWRDLVHGCGGWGGQGWGKKKLTNKTTKYWTLAIRAT